MRLQLLLLEIAACFMAVCSQTDRDIIDTSQPIVRRAPAALASNAYFGYSLVLHKIRTDETDMASALANTRIVVGAPRGTAPGGAVAETGLIYTCPLAPGNCSGLTGQAGDPDDARLFDDQPNEVNREEKSGQFMGVSLASTGDQFIACAHRYVSFQNNDVNSRHPFGRCFFSDRDLQGFTEFQPCDGVGVRATFSVGVCQAGTSAALAADGNGNTAIGVGSPGVYTWRGIVIRRSSTGSTGSTSFEAFNDGTDLFGYQGYSMTKGRLIQTNREDFAVSVPRFNLYTGQVNIIVNNIQLSVVSQGLAGTQMGEYFGFSLVALDLDGDGLDELLVGAPMYRNGRNADAGRVFIYSNTGGSLNQVGMLVGSEEFGRFGYAMANLGDISGDNLDDVAISAPFDSEGGTVFIYHSSPSTTLLLTATPQQTITASRLNLNPPITRDNITGFGTALASGVDVDGNTYNDLAISSFQSQEVFVLRSRPVALVRATMSSTPNIVDVQTRNCSISGDSMMYSCFRLDVCLTYSGDGVSNELTLNAMIFADRRLTDQGLEQRFFFDNSMRSNVYSINITVDNDASVPECFNVTVFVSRGITDIFNSFTIDLEVDSIDLITDAGNGNEPAIDFSSSPFVSLTGMRSLPVAIQNNCSIPCTPNLAINLGAVSPSSQLTAGLVSSFSVPINVRNLDVDDAFASVVSFTIPRMIIVFDRLAGVLSPCEEVMEETTSTWTCGIGNPFLGNTMNDFTAFFSLTSAFTGGEGAVNIPFSLSSLNGEDDTLDHLTDNSQTLTLQADARATISLDDPAIITPAQVSYASVALEGQIDNVTQLGAGFDAAFVVRNSGPSTVPELELTIFWPLSGPETESFYFLYTASITGSGSGTVQCDTTNINPDNIAGSSITDEGFENESGGRSADGRRRRRRRRSVPKGERMIVKRQDGEDNSGDDRTLMCGTDSSSDGVTCVQITCSILQLPQNGRTEIDVIGFIDDRFFGGQVDRYSFITSASVRIVNGDFIDQPQDGGSNTATAQLRVIPATSTATRDKRNVPWYAIVIPIIVGLGLIITAFIILWRFGFFRRKKREELLKRQEELQGGLSQSKENILEATDDGNNSTNL